MSIAVNQQNMLQNNAQPSFEVSKMNIQSSQELRMKRDLGMNINEPYKDEQQVNKSQKHLQQSSIIDQTSTRLNSINVQDGGYIDPIDTITGANHSAHVTMQKSQKTLGGLGSEDEKATKQPPINTDESMLNLNQQPPDMDLYVPNIPSLITGFHAEVNNNPYIHVTDRNPKGQMSYDPNMINTGKSTLFNSGIQNRSVHMIEVDQFNKNAQKFERIARYQENERNRRELYQSKQDRQHLPNIKASVDSLNLASLQNSQKKSIDNFQHELNTLKIRELTGGIPTDDQGTDALDDGGELNAEDNGQSVYSQIISQRNSYINQGAKKKSKQNQKSLQDLKKLKNQYTEKLNLRLPGGSKVGVVEESKYLHPSYYMNERYQKLYKDLLKSEGNNANKPSYKDVEQYLMDKVNNKTESGIPLSNQILYEKLDVNDHQMSQKTLKMLSQIQSQDIGKNRNSGLIQNKVQQQLIESGSSRMMPGISFSNVHPSKVDMFQQIHTDHSKVGIIVDKNSQSEISIPSEYNKKEPTLDQLSSIMELKQVSTDLTPRKTSIWKQNNPGLDPLRVDNQHAFFQKYLQGQIKQIPQYALMPTTEVLFAKEKNYHPDKVKILLSKSIKQKDQMKGLESTLQSHGTYKLNFNQFTKFRSKQGSTLGYEEGSSVNGGPSLGRAISIDQNPYRQSPFVIRSPQVKGNGSMKSSLSRQNINIQQQNRAQGNNASGQQSPTFLPAIDQGRGGVRKQPSYGGSHLDVYDQRKSKNNLGINKNRVRAASHMEFVSGLNDNSNLPNLSRHLSPSIEDSIDETDELMDSMPQNTSVLTQDYEDLLQEKENQDNSLNKLKMKRHLIAEAVGKSSKPRVERKYVSDIMKVVNEYTSIVDLPEDDTMKITSDIVKEALSRVPKEDKAKSWQPYKYPQLNITTQELMLRKRDHRPYYTAMTRNLPGFIEPVYLSHHYDFKKQQIIDPVHLNSLIKEIEFCQQMPLIEKEILKVRLQEWSYCKTLRMKHIKQITKEMQIKHRTKAIPPEHSEIYVVLDNIVNKLILYLATNEVQSLEKLGILGQHLTKMMLSDMGHFNQHMTAVKWEQNMQLKEMQAKMSAEDLRKHQEQQKLLDPKILSLEGSQQFQLGLSPSIAKLAQGLNLNSKNNSIGEGSTSRRNSVEQSDDEEQSQPEESEKQKASHKQKPYQLPKSREFFDSLKKNDVLKCLKMLQANPMLVEDVDPERKTGLHWACALDCHNMAQVLVDFGATINAKDDFNRRAYDEALAFAQSNYKEVNKKIEVLFQKVAENSYKRDIVKYESPLYVKYLTPVEHVKELADFIKRVNDMSTLTHNKKKVETVTESKKKESKPNSDSDEEEDIEEQIKKVTAQQAKQ